MRPLILISVVIIIVILISVIVVRIAAVVIVGSRRRSVKLFRGRSPLIFIWRAGLTIPVKQHKSSDAGEVYQPPPAALANVVETSYCR